MKYRAETFWNSLAWITGASGIALFCTLLLSTSSPTHVSEADKADGALSIRYLLQGLTLTVVVDCDGVLIGDKRFTTEEAERVIPLVIQQNAVRSLKILTTDRATYGSFVKILGTAQALARNRVAVNVIQKQPQGYVAAFSRSYPVCCYSVEYPD